MFVLPEIKLPNEFTQLLKSSIFNTSDSIEKLSEVIDENKNFSDFIKNVFADVGKGYSVKKIIKHLGWKNFRDRLSSIYLYHFKYGHYPRTSQVNLVEDISSLENSSYSITGSSFSRSHMLGLYLKFANAQNSQTLQIPLVLCELLKELRVKVIKCDWPLLVLWHFVEYAGTNHVSDIVKSGQFSYDYFYNYLSNEQKENYISNLLAYCYSIDEDDFWSHKVI